jgi:2-iminoacetate synthase ThiH
MIEENVVSATGVGHRMSLAEMVRLIQTAGFRSEQRDNVHGPVERMNTGETPALRNS